MTLESRLNQETRSLLPIKRVETVFGAHLTGDESNLASERFGKILLETGRYPGLSSWDGKVVDRVAGLNPGILVSDGDSVDLGFQDPNFPGLSLRWRSPSSLFYQPGNPFELRKRSGGLLIVDADISKWGLLQFKAYQRAVAKGEQPAYYPGVMAQYSPEERLARDLVSQGAIAYFEKYNNLPIEESNKATFNEMERAVQKRGQIEYGAEVISSGVILSYVLNRLLHTKMSRHQFLKVSTYLALLAGVNFLRHGITGAIAIANRSVHQRTRNKAIFDYNEIEERHHKWWGRPLSGYYTGTFDTPFILISDLKDLDLREAVADIKGNEVPDLFPQEPLPPGPTVQVWGSAHKYGKNRWNDQKAQGRVVQEAFTEILTYIKEAGAEQVKQNPALKQAIVDQLAKLFGGMAVWRVEEAPEIYTPEEITKRIPLVGTAISPTISRIAAEAAETVNL